MRTAIIQLFLMLGFIQLPAQSTTEPKRVAFTVTNPSLRTKWIDIRHFDYATKTYRGYGYGMPPLGSHAVNMPVGTRVYEKQNGQWELQFVVHAADEGRKFDLSKDYKLTREESLEVAYAEQNEETFRLEKIDTQQNWETFAQKAGLSMITIRVAGKSLTGKQVFVRAEIPGFGDEKNVGFSRKLSLNSVYRVSYPEGTKLYVCEGPYWEDKPVKETLLVVLDAEKANYFIRI